MTVFQALFILEKMYCTMWSECSYTCRWYENVSSGYVSGFLAKRTFSNSNCDVYKKEHSSTVQCLTYPTEQLVQTVGTAVTV
jgi:hypothetical protein